MDELITLLKDRIEGTDLAYYADKDGKLKYALKYAISMVNNRRGFKPTETEPFEKPFKVGKYDFCGKTYSFELAEKQSDEDGNLILDYVADDGSLEYIYSISFEKTDGRYLGREIAFSFHSFDFQSDKPAGMPEPQVEGNWELKWTLTGTSDSITVKPNVKIGDSEVILLDAEIGQKTVHARYQVNDYWEGWDELVELPQAVCGVRMKDGSEHICGASTSGFEDQENMIYFTEWDISDAILDISQVESLMFHKGWELDANGKPTIQTFYYIPISVG